MLRVRRRIRKAVRLGRGVFVIYEQWEMLFLDFAEYDLVAILGGGFRFPRS